MTRRGADEDRTDARWKRWLPLTLVIGLSVAVLIPLHAVVSEDRDITSTLSPLEAPRSTETPRNVAIICSPSNSGDRTFCARLAADRIGRVQLTEAQFWDRQRAAGMITHALSAGSRENMGCARTPPTGLRPSVAPMPEPCRRELAAMNVVELAAILEQTGYPLAIVRVARDDDPAPMGSLLFAVDIDDACVVGYIATGGPQADPVGHLRDGTCLHR